MELIRSKTGWRGDVRKWMKMMTSDGEVSALRRELGDHMKDIVIKFSADALVRVGNNTDRILINQEAQKLQQKIFETSLRELSLKVDALRTPVGTGGAKAYELPPLRPAQTLPGASRVEQDFWAQRLALPTSYGSYPNLLGASRLPYRPANSTQSHGLLTSNPNLFGGSRPANSIQSHALPNLYPKPFAVSRPRANSVCPKCHVEQGSASRLIDHRAFFGRYHCSFQGICYEDAQAHYNKYGHSRCHRCGVCVSRPNEAVKKHECPQDPSMLI
jgi:hypothetical protein